MYLRPNTTTILKEHGGTPYEVAEYIRYFANHAAKNDVFLNYFANLIKDDPERLRRVFRYACLVATYQEDEPNVQVIKTPKALRRVGVGNCVDYSVTISAFLKVLGLPHKIKIVKFDPNESYAHVYIVTDSGVVLDPVYGKDLNRDEKNIDRYFNKEVPHYNSKYYAN